MQARAVATLFVGAFVIAACGGTQPTQIATSAPATAAPTTAPVTAAPATTPPATSAPTAAATTTLKNAAHGLEITLPAGWVALTPEMAKDSAAVAALKAAAGDKAVDGLIANLNQHPEYWMVGSNLTTSHVIAGTVLTATGDLAAWTTAQQTALTNAYGTVETVPLTTPSAGTRFNFVSGQFAASVFGFARPGGIAMFTFAAPSAAGAPTGWNEIVATFKDAGK